MCLQAPGGYGKSTVLRQWAEEDPRPLVWVSIRPQAPDATWLATEIMRRMVVAGLVQEPTSLPAGADDPVVWHLGVLPVIERAVAQAPAFLLVIDDVGPMQGNAWDCLVASIVHSLPPGGQLALSTRRGLPPSVTRLRSERAAVLVDRDLLAFDRSEEVEVLELLGLRIPEGDARSILEQTAGWPVAVYLSALAMRDSPPGRGRLSSVAGLDDYLRSQILDLLPAPEAEFMLAVSVLTSLDEQVCDAVTGSRDSLARLHGLAANNHLLLLEDDDPDQYRMHPLLAAFLSEELRSSDPQAWRRAHLRASRAYEQRAEHDSAVYHARLCGDEDYLGALVWSHTGRLLTHGQIAVLQRWLQAVEEPRLLAQGHLALASAYVALLQGDLARGHGFRLAAATQAEHGVPIGPEVGLLRAVSGADSLEHVEQLASAFITAGRGEDPWLSVARFLRGVALLASGSPEAAEVEIGQAHAIAVGHDLPGMQVRLLAVMSHLALARDDQPRALGHLRECRELVARHGLDNMASLAPVVVASAMGYVLEGRMVDARREAMRALRLTSLMRVLPAWNVVHGQLVLARVFLALNDVENAHVLLDEAEASYGPQVRSPLADRLLDDVRASLSERQTTAGVRVLTTAELRVLQYLPTHLSFPQIAETLFLSRHTVKTQALSAYRKLGAHNRAEAVEKARHAGLLPWP